MEEHFLTYEQSLAVKELGFDEVCFAYFNDGKHICYTGIIKQNTNTFWHDKAITSPLKSQFFKWVRERHGIDVHTSKNGEKAINLGGKKYVFFIETTSGVNPSNTIFEDTYEQAEDACINKIIELLKLK